MKTVASPYAGLVDAVEVRTQKVDVLGSATRYWEYGPVGAEVTIVAVHGFRGDHNGLESIVAHLCANDPRIRVISPDLPGFGVSEPLHYDVHDLAGYASWLRAFLDRLGLLGTAVVLGHSFGSIVVAAALGGGLPAPRAILINPIASPALSGPNAVGTRLAIFYYWLGARLPERLGFWILRWRLVTRGISIFMTKSKDPVLRRWVHNQHDRFFGAFANRQVVLDAFRASVSHDVSEYAPSIAIPVQLIAAELDDITPVADNEALARLFPSADLKMIPGVGHLIHYEVPAEAARQIDAFVLPQSPPAS
ncbi:alpha/beta fold hydrolase [Naasia lichenicola]|uniref:Alpha/beta hydrolase n=1 Tax=Naasia lichenicola TaxID=2565933 RepID=A0A4S4FT74_9MICO|nr:alpha/beta hydrolase [Naasia lichenicola]THG33132.1 alpha/beta hydrolase [Naasia lichenicola]